MAAGVSPVQTGIWYAPDVRFALFDITIEHDNDAQFLSHTEVQALGASHGLFVVPLLDRGPRAALESLPVRFPSRVASLLRLPTIAQNIAEGFVLKPDVRASVADRYVTKWKIPELDDARFDDSAPWDPDAMIDLPALSHLAGRMVNPARIASARSKVGTDPTAICEETTLDVLVDLEAAFPAALRSLASDEDALRAHIHDLARALVAR
jgi:hypothetical protein